MIIPSGKRAEIVKPSQQLTAKNGFLANPRQHGNTVNQSHEKLPLLFVGLELCAFWVIYYIFYIVCEHLE